ncbi:peptidoglycan-binding protein [Kitasatospora sp. NPDC004615]|uniref:peptidoglycan-binding domain-containing protein n=1 Tax=Kitasatospora sp. NPDC004615 TaxID=3364017 RepID=UPI0036B12EC7
MPADRCPSCGTVGPAGSCACHAFSPAEQTAVLPPLDGPHLVRPYVADTPVLMEPGHPAADPFGTQVGPPPVQPITTQAGPPPVQPITTQTVPFVPPQPSAPGAVPPPPPGRAPHVPQAAGPFAPPAAQSDAAATQLLPPVQEQGSPAPFQLGRVVPPPPQPEPPTALIPPIPTDPGTAATALIPPIPAGPDPATTLLPPVPDGPKPPPATDLGLFGFHDDESAAPVSRTERRSQRRRSADRKRLVIAGGAVGVTALAVSMAMLLSSSPDSVDHALPAPTGPGVASSAATTPSAPSSGEASPDASASADSPSPTRSSARPSQSVATKPAAAPTTAPPEPTSAPPASPSSSPSPSANRTLRRNDTGPDVVQLQHLLMKAACMPVNWLDGDITDKYQTGFGAQTQSALMNFQWKYRSKLKGIEPGVYDPQTQALLQEVAQNPKC